MAEPLISVPGQYDGIAFSSDGRTLYVTNWTPAGLTAIDLATLETSPVACPVEPALAGPADISVADGQIYIPDLPNSRVVISPSSTPASRCGIPTRYGGFAPDPAPDPARPGPGPPPLFRNKTGAPELRDARFSCGAPFSG